MNRYGYRNSFPNFDDIRPLNNSEVKDAIEKLVANEDFERALRYIKPNLNWEEFSVAMRACKTKEEFKSTLAYDAVMTVAKNTTFSLTISGRSRLPEIRRPVRLSRTIGISYWMPPS